MDLIQFTMKKQYSSPLVETVRIEYERGVMDFGSLNAPGQGFDNTNITDYGFEF